MAYVSTKFSANFCGEIEKLKTMAMVQTVSVTQPLRPSFKTKYDRKSTNPYVTARTKAAVEMPIGVIAALKSMPTKGCV